MSAPLKNRNPKARQPVLASSVAAGVMLFVLANLVLWTLRPLSRVDPEGLPAAHTWTWWATREYLERKQPPDVVLLGSSLLMHPVSRLDADFLNRDLDYVHHHRSAYLSAELERRLGISRLSCFNYALPGCMISDDYIIARSMFPGQRKPRLLVLGLSLRDFIDSGVSCPAATPPFRYLKRFVSIDDIVCLAMPQVWQRLDYYVGKLVYLWDKKLDMQVVLAEQVKSRLGPLVDRVCAPSLIARADPERNLPSNLRSEVEESMFIVRAHQPYSWQDNSAEYRKRYRNGQQRLFALQTRFLGKLFDFCRAQEIPVLIVNMPLTPANRALMPPGAYEAYLSLLASTAAERGCRFVDLNTGGLFRKTDFYDTSHMNASGGRKLLDAVAGAIASDTRLAGALSGAQPERQLAEKHNETLQ